LNGFVGAMVGGFDLAGRLVMGVRAVVKAAVGERAAEPFAKEQEEQGDLNPFWGETVGVAGSVTLQQPVGFEFAQVVAELVEPVGAVGEAEGGEDGVVDLLGGPAADLTTAVQEDLEEADDTGVVDLDSGIADRADGDWKGEALQQREVDVDVEPLRLKTGEAAGDGLEALADGIEILEGAGFSEVSLTPFDPEIQLAGPEGEAEAADFVMVMGPLVRVLPSLSAAERQNVGATLEVYFRGHAASQGVVLPAEIWVVQARV
jgi:hypothetical protein